MTQQFVPCVVPECVIDDLELVEVDVEQCMRAVRVGAEFFQRSDETVFELAAVDQSRHRIMRGLVTELPEKP